MTESRIADTFTVSLIRLTGDENKVVKRTAFGLQMCPVNPDVHLHGVNEALALIAAATSLLDRQMQTQAKAFERAGGRLHRTSLQNPHPETA